MILHAEEPGMKKISRNYRYIISSLKVLIMQSLFIIYQIGLLVTFSYSSIGKSEVKICYKKE